MFFVLNDYLSSTLKSFTDSYGMSIIIFLLFLIFVLLLYIAIKIENMNK